MADMMKKATRESYGEALALLADENQDVVVLDADLSKSTKTDLFHKKAPERFFDCGIAEGNMIKAHNSLNLSRENHLFLDLFMTLMRQAYQRHVKELKDLSHLAHVNILKKDNYLRMDVHTVRNLELVETLRLKERKYSLIWLLDKTKTAPGARCLKNWLMNPLKDRIEIEKRYDYIKFLEIGTDCDYVHLLVQSTPSYSPAQIVKIIKSITARQIFVECPQVKKKLWGGQFWSDGYFVSTVGKNQNETVIREYVKNQGKQDTEYKQLYLVL